MSIITTISAMPRRPRGSVPGATPGATRAGWWRWRALLVSAFTLLALAVLPSLAAPAQAAPSAPARSAQALAGPTPGQAIYDNTGLLTSGEVRALETHAAAVRQAGAAVVVYLRKAIATQEQTQQDAANLMERWGVETSHNAYDGVVIFFNLEPDNPRHGQMALYAGQNLVKGNLPQYELARIYSDVMLPPLHSEQTAQGIAAGLDAITRDLRFGPPAPPPAVVAQRAAAWIGRVPFNVLALLFALGVLMLAGRAPRRTKVTMPESLHAAPPGDLPPALAGALAAGRLHEDQLEATILDFAHRGLLTIEPVAKDKVHARLLGSASGLTRYEMAVWRALERAADADGIVTADRLAEVRTNWAPATTALRSELLRRGWYDTHAGERRTPLYLAGSLGILLAVLGIILAILAGEGWALLGVALFTALAVVAFVRAARVPDTTEEGERAALPWREYQRSLKAGLPLGASDNQLDVALPYAVAMGVSGAVNSRLVAASANGYSPSWLTRRQDEGHEGYVHFYPYWIAFHHCMYPPTSGTGGYGGGGVSAGGAASGGAGAGGGF
ncbi:MAG TPA: TPM domain-containing protein [Ktedonobacterales bacterium]